MRGRYSDIYAGESYNVKPDFTYYANPDPQQPVSINNPVYVPEVNYREPVRDLAATTTPRAMYYDRYPTSPPRTSSSTTRLPRIQIADERVDVDVGSLKVPYSSKYFEDNFKPIWNTYLRERAKKVDEERRRKRYFYRQQKRKRRLGHGRRNDPGQTPGVGPPIYHYQVLSHPEDEYELDLTYYGQEKPPSKSDSPRGHYTSLRYPHNRVSSRRDGHVNGHDSGYAGQSSGHRGYGRQGSDYNSHSGHGSGYGGHGTGYRGHGSGYGGHGSGHGGHGSGYGNQNSGYDGHDSYGYGGHGGHSSGYGHHGLSGHKECCVLVVDPLTLAAFIMFIGGATFILNRLIIDNIPPGKRKRRRKRSHARAAEKLVGWKLHGN